MPNGSIHKIKKGRPTLKKGSVPYIFPNLPSYLSSGRKRRKSPCIRTESTEIKKRKSDLSNEPHRLTVIVKNTTSEENEAVSYVCEKKENNPCLFECLKDSLNKILTPHGSWSGTFLAGRNEIIFAEWDETYTTVKKIVLHYDMSYKVRCTHIRHIFSSLPNLMCNTNVKQIHGFGIGAMICKYLAIFTYNFLFFI